MSYEYTINLKKISDLDSILDALQSVSLASGVLCYLNFGVIYLKDPDVPNSWKYDVAIFSKETYIEISLVGWSLRLYSAFKRALGTVEFNIVDDDLGKEVTLKNVFRV